MTRRDKANKLRRKILAIDNELLRWSDAEHSEKTSSCIEYARIGLEDAINRLRDIRDNHQSPYIYRRVSPGLTQ